MFGPTLTWTPTGHRVQGFGFSDDQFAGFRGWELRFGDERLGVRMLGGTPNLGKLPFK